MHSETFLNGDRSQDNQLQCQKATIKSWDSKWLQPRYNCIGELVAFKRFAVHPVVILIIVHRVCVLATTNAVCHGLRRIVSAQQKLKHFDKAWPPAMRYVRASLFQNEHLKPYYNMQTCTSHYRENFLLSVHRNIREVFSVNILNKTVT